MFDHFVGLALKGLILEAKFGDDHHFLLLIVVWFHFITVSTNYVKCFKFLISLISNEKWNKYFIEEKLYGEVLYSIAAILSIARAKFHR